MTGERSPPTAAVPFALAGFEGLTLRGAEQAVHTRLLPDPMQRAREGRPLRTSMARLTSRVHWDGVGPVLLKVHRTRSLGERLLSLVRRSRARAEWDAARFLTAAGLPVPEALAVGEQRRMRMLASSFYAARFLEGLLPVDDVLPQHDAGKRAVLLERLAALIRRMHDLGFDHRDLHAGNVLAGPGAGDGCRLVVTDLHRSRSGGTVAEGARRAALARWLHSLRTLLDVPARRAWLGAYLGAERAAETAAWSRDVEARIARLERIRRRSRGKRCLKESTVYTRDVGRGWGGRRRDLPLERLEAVLRDHERARTPGRPGFVKRSSKGVVTRHGDIVVKERRAVRALARLRDGVFPRRHAAGYRNAHMLGVLGIGTARPLAYVRRDGSSFSLYEDLSALPRLDAYARELYAGCDRSAQVRLREASAAWLGRLHAAGIYHGDLKGVNVLVERGADDVAFRLIDTDRCRYLPAGVDDRRRLKNLGQLAASIPRSITRSERLRWYRRYADAAGVQRKERVTATRVAAALARKIVVVDEPIE